MIPCDGCQPEEAATWVRSNIEDGGEATIGPVRYTLSRSGGAWVLQMAAA